MGDTADYILQHHSLLSLVCRCCCAWEPWSCVKYSGRVAYLCLIVGVKLLLAGAFIHSTHGSQGQQIALQVFIMLVIRVAIHITVLCCDCASTDTFFLHARNIVLTGLAGFFFLIVLYLELAPLDSDKIQSFEVNFATAWLVGHVLELIELTLCAKLMP